MKPFKHTDDHRSSKPVLDFHGVMRRIQDDTELFCEFVGYYDDEAGDLLQALEDAIRRQDAGAVHRAAHSLKGLVGNLGGEAVRDAAFRLERESTELDWPEVASIWGELQQEVELLDVQLQEYRSKPEYDGRPHSKKAGEQ